MSLAQHFQKFFFCDWFGIDGHHGADGSLQFVEQYFVTGTGTWLAALLTPVKTIASVVFLLPDPGAHDDTVQILDATTTLAVELELEALTPITVPMGAGFAVDWSSLELDGLGNPISAGALDRLLLGRFDADLAELEERGPALLVSAEELWTIEVEGYRADLAGLCPSEGFCGVDADSTWLLALSCSTCLNPAPLFVTRLVGVRDTAPEEP